MSAFSTVGPVRVVLAGAPLVSEFLSPEDLPALLDDVYVLDHRLAGSESGVVAQVKLAFEGELAWKIPGLAGTSFVAGGGHPGYTIVHVSVRIAEDWEVAVRNLALALRFDPGVIRPAAFDGAAAEGEHVSVEVEGSVRLTHTFDLEVEGFDAFSVSPFTIGDTGIVVAADEVKLDLSRTSSLPDVLAAGFDDSFLGLYLGEARVQLPEALRGTLPSDLRGRDLVIGTGGVSGEIGFSHDPRPTFDPQTHEFAGEGGGGLFGLPFALHEIDIAFRQNALTRSRIEGEMFLPYFDQRLGVELGLDLEGNLSVDVRAPSDEGLVLRRDNLLEVKVESIGFEVEDGEASVSLSGEIRPLVGDLDWPSFRVDELRIGADGNVHVKGGWLDLPDQYSLDFHGFGFEITKIGFGRTEEGENWIGFNGGVKFVDELSAGASVEGLRIAWPSGATSLAPEDVRLSFDGVGVELEVPDAIRFSGEVAFREIQTPEGLVRRFDGAVSLALPTLDMEIDGVLVIGSAPGYTFLAIHLDLSLAAGIPIFNTGLALYGMAGLLALNMEPGKRSDEEWYGAEPGEGWYRRPEVGVTDLKDKWVNRRGSLALGAGVTLGTVSDNGYAFSGKLLFALVLPGPIVLLEGKANVLAERAKLDEEPTFRALIVFDGRAGTLTAGLDARYRFDAEHGLLVDVEAGVDAFFSFSDPDAWHVYLGEREPREKRVRARMYSIAEGTAYLMVDPRQLGMGGSIGFDADYSFGPLSVDLEAWIEAHALLSTRPPHFHGEIWLHGRIALSVFGFGLGLTADARIGADVLDPYHLVGEFRVSIDLPWPLDDYGASVRVEWGPRPGRPRIPLPLEDVSIEHLKTTTAWPLPRRLPGGEPLLRPDFSRDGYYGEAPSVDVDAFPENAPVVPLDARPRLTFGRSVHDEGGVGDNPQPVVPRYERIGDPGADEGPMKVRYSLRSVELQALRGNQWKTLARSGGDVGADDKLSGSWAPVPALPSGDPAPGTPSPTANTKLWLWSRNAFDFGRRTGGGWNERFLADHPGYPCVFERRCHDFAGYESVPIETVGESGGSRLRRVEHPDEEELRFLWEESLETPFPFAGIGLSPTGDRRLSFVFAEAWSARAGPEPDTSVEGMVRIDVPRPSRSVRLALDTPKIGRVVGIDRRGRRHDPLQFSGTRTVTLSLDAREWAAFEVYGAGAVHVAEVCHASLPLESAGDEEREMAERLRDGTRGWSRAGFVLEPYTRYRLRVATGFHAQGEGKLEGVEIRPNGTLVLDDGAETLENVIVEHAYFRTEGPPGLSALSIPVPTPDPAQVARRDASGRLRARRADGTERAVQTPTELDADERLLLESDLDGLSRYVRATVPPTTPGEDGKPRLVRPVYRAYDLGIDFNEDYVDLLYRGVRRGLALSLHDRNDEPVRDAAGRPVSPPVRWGREPELSLDPEDALWVAALNGGGCASIEPGKIQRNPRLRATPGHVLDPDTVYEARLVPRLLQDDFRDRLGWTVVDEAEGTTGGRWVAGDRPILSGRRATVLGDLVDLGEAIDVSDVSPALDALVIFDPDTGAPRRFRMVRVYGPDRILLHDLPPPWEGRLRWEIPGGPRLDQRERVGGGSPRGRARGTLLVASLPERPAGERPDAWTDYRFTARVRPMGSVVQGIVFRFRPGEPYLRFSMAREVLTHVSGFRQLALIHGDSHTVLAQDRFIPVPDREYLVTAECVGETVRIYQDGELVLEAVDPTPAAERKGAPGLYSYAGPGRFGEIEVDDLRPGQPCVHRFSFGTSAYANFHHHLHGFQDEAWTVALPRPDALDAPAAEAVPLSSISTPPSEGEARAYDRALEALGMKPHHRPGRIEASHLARYGEDGETELAGFLLRSPEPLDWPRLAAEVSRADGGGAAASPPRSVKVTGGSLGAEESVTLLARETMDLEGYAVEFRDLERGEGEFRAEIFSASFDDDRRGRDAWEFVDEPPYTTRRSKWRITGGEMRQLSNIYGFVGGPYREPGTYAVTRGDHWTDYRLDVRLRSDDNDAIGVLFRYRGEDDYYRFSMDCERRYRRLVRHAGGRTTLLWEDEVPYQLGRWYDLRIDCVGDRLEGTLDGEPLFAVRDAELAGGGVGLYCRANRGARFASVRVRAAASAWTRYLTVGESTVAPAGTRIRIAPTSTPAGEAEAGLLRREADAPAETPRLSAEGAEIRVLAPDGTVEHARALRPAGDYAPLGSLRTLRRADGTGLLLLREPDASGRPGVFAAGDAHRLSLVYRRDDRELRPGSSVLSQGGDTSDERACIDIPPLHPG